MESNSTPSPATEMKVASAEVARVALKIPPLWKKNIRIWFVQLESQFDACGITSEDTKYNYVLSSLEPEVAESISDLILNKPSAAPYTILKDRLINDFTASDSVRLKALLQDIELGDKKPSVLLRQMRQLSNNQCTDEFLRTIFMDRLPVSVKTILATNSSASLEELGQMGDKIIEVLPSNSAVASIGNSVGETVSINMLCEQISKLTEQVNQLYTRSRSQSRYKTNRSRNRSRSQSTSSNDNRDLCWYHQRFQDKAKKCTAPCSFKKQEN